MSVPNTNTLPPRPNVLTALACATVPPSFAAHNTLISGFACSIASDTGCALSASQPAWSATTSAPGSAFSCSWNPAFARRAALELVAVQDTDLGRAAQLLGDELHRGLPVLTPRSAFFVTRNADGIVGSLTHVLKQMIGMPASFACFNAATDPSAEIGVITIAFTPRVM